MREDLGITVSMYVQQAPENVFAVIQPAHAASLWAAAALAYLHPINRSSNEDSA